MAGGGLIPGEYIWFCIAQEMEVCVIFHKQLGVCVVAVPDNCAAKAVL